MTDEHLRDAERRWRESGDADAQGTFLLALVRAGELPGERVRLAAYCGHAGAIAALGPTEVPPAPREWAAGLMDYPREASVAALLRLARDRLSAWQQARPNDDRPALAIEAAQRWLQAPAPDAASEAQRLGRDAREAERDLVSLADPNQVGRGDPMAEVRRREAAAAGTAAYLASLAAQAAASPTARHASDRLLTAISALDSPDLGPMQEAVSEWALQGLRA